MINGGPGAEALLDKLRKRIRSFGPIALDHYIEACLFDPEYGYYGRAEIIGAGGDYVTAPEISQTFGEMLGLWCALAWETLGRPPQLRLVELGPGRGTLMRDLLRAGRAMPEFLDAISVHLVEISPHLRAAQHQALAPLRLPLSPSHPRKGEANVAALSWHETVEEVPKGPAIVIANEFLDALPIRQLVHSNGAWRERMVDVDAEGNLCFVLGPAVAYDRLEHADTDQRGATMELRAGEEALLAALAARRDPLIALFIDYGPEEAPYGDTLQAVRGHTHVDPLASPGTADITAHVRFGAFARKAVRTGFAVEGPMPQAEFLGRLGIAERAARLMAANPGRAGEIEAGVHRLLAPSGMGTLFKAIAVRSRHVPPPHPFDVMRGPSSSGSGQGSRRP
jgi:SAM-dependent MidA family methyltransferase